MKTNFILLGIASIIVILVMSAKKKEAFREGQGTPQQIRSCRSAKILYDRMQRISPGARIILMQSWAGASRACAAAPCNGRAPNFTCVSPPRPRPPPARDPGTGRRPPPPRPRPPPPVARPRPRPPPPPPPAVRAASGAACTKRDVVRVGNRWENCCVRCGQGYSATSTRGDGGRCLTCGVARPPPPPATCASFTCPPGNNRNSTQQCGETGCNLSTCCKKIPREEIPNCIRHLGWGRNCLECDGKNGYKLSCGKDNCELMPIVEIPNCSKQRNWGKYCINCNRGYKLANKNTQCDLIPIPNCKVQEHEFCLNCNEGWQVSKDGKKCDRIPMTDIKHCTKQREWGAHCYECGDKTSGWTPSPNKEKCDAIPIKNCGKQTEIHCDVCNFGYELLEDKRKCNLIEIDNCSDQNGVICKECKIGYHMSEDRRACALLPIANCKTREEPAPKKITAEEAAAAYEVEEAAEKENEEQAIEPKKKLVGADFASFAAVKAKQQAEEAKQRDGFRELSRQTFKANCGSGFGKNQLYSIC